MTMFYGAATSITIFIFISSTTITAHAKIEQTFDSNSETRHNLVQQNAAVAEESPLQVRPPVDNVAEPDEHHRIVILVPQLVHPAAAAAARARKPKKKKPIAPKPQPPKKKPKVHHHHPHHVVPVVHSGKVIHAHHHHGAVEHGHSHAAKAKHTHKHFVNANHKHGHYGVGRITHKHVGPVKPPPSPPPHKPKHPHLTAVDVFNQQNSYFNPPQRQHQYQHQNQHRLRQYPAYHQYNQYNNQPQTSPQQQPPPHLQHQQQVLHHRSLASAAPNFFNNPATAAVDPYSFYNGGGGVPAAGSGPFGNRGRTANDRRDFLAPPSGGGVSQLIQIRRIPEENSFDTFIDKNTRSSLAAAALAFGNENLNVNNNFENENEAEVEAEAAAEADDETENENENEKENELTEDENENEKDDETTAGYVSTGALERAIEEAAFDAVPRQKINPFVGRSKRPFGAPNVAGAVPSASEENFATLQLNSIDHGGAGLHQNEASLHYATFANPPQSQPSSPKNKIIAFSDAYHYQY